MRNPFGKLLFGLAAVASIYADSPSDEAESRAEHVAEEKPRQKIEQPKTERIVSPDTQINPYLNAEQAKAYFASVLQGMKRDSIDKTVPPDPSQIADGKIGITSSITEKGFAFRLDEFGDLQKDDTSLDTGSQEDTFPDDGEKIAPVVAKPESDTPEKGWNGILEAKLSPETKTMELSPTQNMADVMPTITVSGTGTEMKIAFQEYLSAIKIANDLDKTEMSRTEIKKIMEQKFEKQLKK